jgi:hypothetical protein
MRVTNEWELPNDEPLIGTTWAERVWIAPKSMLVASARIQA